MNVEQFREKLRAWFAANARDLPWRRTCDPYRIWLSETMLQQTRAAAAIPYYEEFLARFPDVGSLARASESEVLAAWSGLGYYHRARNLHNSARRIVENGRFPETHEGILSLPGVGGYTAAAVGSIAFGLPHAVLDGNVMRVIARMTADPGDIGSGKTQKRFQQIADCWLDRTRPGAFNQAMMELGATVCLPRNPQCLLCPVSVECEANRRGAQAEYPIKAPKAISKAAESDLLVVRRGNRVLLKQREATESKMALFWELPERQSFPRLRAEPVASFSHTIVNTRWLVRVHLAKAGSRVQASEGMQWLAREQFREFPVTTVTKKALALTWMER